MTLSATLSEHPAPDPRIARAERWLVMLGGLTLIGKWMVDALLHHISPAEHGPTWAGPRIVFPIRFDPITVVMRVMRAIRLALLLEMRIEDDIARLRAGKPPRWDALAPEAVTPEAVTPEASASEASAPGALSHPGAEEAMLGDELREIGLEALAGDMEAPERPENPLGDLHKSYQEDPNFYRLLNGPLEDAVAAICAALGLQPDWSQWTEDGFPPPPDGDVGNWEIFLAPDGEVGPAPGPASRDVDGEGTVVWRPSWRRRKSHKPAAPVHASAPRRPEMALSP